jgi:hypothetical protein
MLFLYLPTESNPSTMIFNHFEGGLFLKHVIGDIIVRKWNPYVCINTYVLVLIYGHLFTPMSGFVLNHPYVIALRSGPGRKKNVTVCMQINCTGH